MKVELNIDVNINLNHLPFDSLFQYVCESIIDGSEILTNESEKELLADALLKSKKSTMINEMKLEVFKSKMDKISLEQLEDL